LDTSKLGILTTSHARQKQFLKSSLECCRAIKPAVIVGAREVTLLPEKKGATMNDLLPAYDVMSLADMWYISEFYHSVASWHQLSRYGLSLIQEFGGIEYVFAIEGDCVMDEPGGIHDIYDILIEGGGDIICAEYSPMGRASPCSYLAKIDVIAKVLDYINTYKGIPGYGSGPEGRFGNSIIRNNFKCIPVRNPTTSHFGHGDRGTWGDWLGFRHLHAEVKWRASHHIPPIEEKHYDKRYLRAKELKALQIFWDTGKTDHLIEMGYWPEEKRIRRR
jgi:hypothetical protein